MRQKARKIVSEIEEAEAAKKPAVPDEVKRRHAERAQLLREVEGVADTHDFGGAAEIVTRAAAAWAALGGDEGDDRFSKSVERFWRRKELHDSQARSGSELRAIGREAAAAKARAAAERAAAAAAGDAPAEPTGEPGVDAPDAIDEFVRPDAPVDPRREAREAEARARREGAIGSAPRRTRAGRSRPPSAPSRPRRTPSAAPRSPRASRRCAPTWSSSGRPSRRTRARSIGCWRRPPRRSTTSARCRWPSATRWPSGGTARRAASS